MAIERINSVSFLRPFYARDERSRQSLPPGDTQRFTYLETQGDDVLVTAGDGRPVRLSGLASLAQGLAEGDILLMKVISAGAELGLELHGAAQPGGARGASSFQGEAASMRLDQAAMLQMVSHRLDAAALARRWQTMVLGASRGLAPPGGVPTGSAPLASDDQTLTTAPERLLYSWPGWGGGPVSLQIVQAEEDVSQGRRLRQKSALGIQVEIELPGGRGRARLQLQWIVGGIQLVMLAEQEASLEYLRDALAMIAAAFSAAGLRLLRCRISRIPGMGVRQAPPSGVWDPVGPGLFRAAAEAVIILMALPVSPASR